MNLAFRLKMAKQRGEKLVQELGITSLDVNPITIAAKHDIVVEAKPDAREGVSGMLLRYGNAFGIMYATHVQSEGFRRFSIAHELGHYFLDGHPEKVLKDGVHSSYAGFVTNDPYELEADNFAAGLLMPSQLVRPILRRRDPGFSVVESLAETCKTSLTATAIRYAELTDDAVAVIVSTGQTIDYCCLSDTIKTLRPTWLRKGSPVPQGTATSRFNSQAQKIAAAERDYADIDIQDWLGGQRSVATAEEVIGLGSYGKTLTVLSCPTLQRDEGGSDDEEESDEAMTERWTPRFRR